MTRLRKCLLVALAVAVAPVAFGFSLLGPLKTWQVTGLGYDLPGDIGGLMSPAEGYRWTVPTVTYAFDQSFVEYFGKSGMAAVDAAFKILNDLPPSTQITNDGANIYVRGEMVPTDTKRINFEAQAVGLLDLKSTALALVVEQLGLAEPERWVWALRARAVQTVAGTTYTNYSTVQWNFDPITRQPSPYVNGVLYTYQILDPIRPINYADAVEFEGDLLAFTYSSVAGGWARLFSGEFYTGLTRDDVGGLKFLLDPNNLANETLINGVTVTSGGTRGTISPWTPFFGSTNLTGSTNVFPGFGTNATNFIVQGLRRGVNKVRFQRVSYDSLVGTGFTPITNTYSDLVITNGRTVTQTLSRTITQPDFLFLAYDLGVVTYVPVLISRSGTGNWINEDAINGQGPQGGPGVIQGPVQIAFSDILPYFLNTSLDDDELSEGTSTRGFVWGSFDGTTNAPIIYPHFKELTLDDIRQQALGGGGN